MKPHNLFFLIFVILLLTSDICTQRPHFTFIQAKEGLSGNTQWSVNSVAVDKHGFIWFCTMEGLNRWDGYTIKSYGNISNDQRDLPNRNISSIAVDKDNNLWLGTQEEGIIYFDTKKEKFTHFDSRSYSKDSIDFKQINHLLIDKNNILYIATAFQGLHKYDLNTKKISSYKDLNKDAFNSINCILLTRENRLVVAAFNGAYYEHLPNQFKHYPIDNKEYTSSLTELSDTKFLIFCSNVNHHFILDIENQTLNKYDNALPDKGVNIAYDNQNNLWTSYRLGDLIKENFDTKKIETFAIKTKLYGNDVTIAMKGMLPHNDKIYFMSLGAGAGYFSTNSLLTPFLDPSFYHLKKMDGNLYAAKNGTLYQIEGNKPKAICHLVQGHKSDYILGYFVSKRNGILITHTGQNGYLSIFDNEGKQQGKVINLNCPAYYQQLQSGQIVGENRNKGFSDLNLPIRFVGDLYTKLSGKKITDFRVKYFTELKNGEVWIATFKDGIIRIYDKLSKYEVMPMDAKGNGKLNSNNTYYLYEHSSGLVFIATDMGINIWNPKTKIFDYLSMTKNNTSKNIMGMVEDKSGKLWIQLVDALMCYDLSKKEIYTYPLDAYYHSEDQYPKDLILDEKGNICFSTFNGYFKFDQNQFLNLEGPNNVLITDVYVKRNRVYPDDEYQLLTESILSQKTLNVPYKNRDLGFSFVSMDGKDKDVTYYYKLYGYQDEWTATKDDRTIHFTNLDPGNYTFQVKGRSGNGKETLSITELNIKVQAPWYQRWYAYLLYTMALSSLAYTMYRIRIKQLLKYQSLRTKISSDLHDDVGTILTGIAMQSEIMSYDKESDDKSLLLNLSTMSRDAMERMRDIVWALDARKDSYDDLLARMKEYAEVMLGKKEIKYDFDISIGTGLKGINPEQRQNLYFIFKEAIANIIKHSNATKVVITINKNTNETIMIIKDNGTILSSNESSGQGISNINMRAKRIAGEAVLEREDGYAIKVVFKS